MKLVKNKVVRLRSVRTTVTSVVKKITSEQHEYSNIIIIAERKGGDSIRYIHTPMSNERLLFTLGSFKRRMEGEIYGDID